MKSACSFLVLKLKSESLLLSYIDVVSLKDEIKKNGLKPLTISVSLKCLQRGSRETSWVQVVSLPWVICCCVTANMKVIKTQSEPNPSYFLIGSLWEDVQFDRA